MSLNYALRLTRGLQMDVRVGLGLSAVQQESHDEGDYYRHDGHLLMQGLVDSNLRWPMTGMKDICRAAKWRFSIFPPVIAALWPVTRATSGFSTPM